MKKAITIVGIMMLLMVGLVSAASNTSGQIRLSIMPVDEASLNITTINKTEFRATHRELSGQMNDIQSLRNSSLTGLENARLRVTNEQAAQRIEANILKLDAKYQLMLKNLTKTQIAEGENNTIVIQGKDEVKLLGFIKVNRGVTFVANEDGSVTRIARPMDFVFKHKVY